MRIGGGILVAASGWRMLGGSDQEASIPRQVAQTYDDQANEELKVRSVYPMNGALHLNFATDQPDAVRLFVADLAQHRLGDWIVTQTWTGKSQEGGRVTVVSDQEAGFKLI